MYKSVCLRLKSAPKFYFTRGITNYYKIFPQTLPQGPPPAGNFEIDLKQLRSEYIQAQRNAHPDVAGEGSQVSSADISNAYRALANPLTRAEHILALNDLNPLEESASLDDEDLLMEIMITRERVSDAERVDELGPIAADNEKLFAESEAKVAAALNKGDFETAKSALIELTYLNKVRQAIDEKKEKLEGESK